MRMLKAARMLDGQVIRWQIWNQIYHVQGIFEGVGFDFKDYYLFIQDSHFEKTPITEC